MKTRWSSLCASLGLSVAVSVLAQPVKPATRDGQAPLTPNATTEAEAAWQLARQGAQTHRFSTLFTAQDVRGYLGSEEGWQQAMAWCKKTGVTKVYIEAFRDGYQA